MPYYSDELIEEVRSRNDIVDVIGSYVHLQKKGSTYFGLCPFHNEKTGSFSVSPNKQMYYCFGCGAGGNVFTFLMQYENFTFPEAMQELADRVGIELPKQEMTSAQRREADRRTQLLEINKEAAKYFYMLLRGPRGQRAHEYFKKRELSDETMQKFGLGYSDQYSDDLYKYLRSKGYDDEILKETGLVTIDEVRGGHDKFWNRAMFPIMDVHNRVIGFGGRVMGDGEPKYLNSPETKIFDKSRNLYGLNIARSTRKNQLLLCEGYMDVIALHQAGFDNAVASMGTALTVEQTRLLSRFTKELVLCYDNDNAGQLATQRALELLNNSEFSVKVLKLPNRMVDGKPTKQDADDFIKNYGPAAFENLLSGSENGVEFRMTQIAARYDLTSDEGRIGYAGEMAEELCRLENAVERDVYTNRAAQTAGLSPEAMKLEVQRAFKRRAARDRKARERQELNLTRSLQPADRAIRYDDLRSAMAEEGVIRLLMQDDSLFPDQPPLREDEFSSPLLGRIYGELWRCRGSGSSMAALSASLTPEEMSHLTTLLQKPESTANAPQALADYIRIIREEGVKRSGRSAMDALAAARDTYKDKKGYGGKRT